MMIKRFVAISLTMFALMLASSCGDDECPNCPTNVDTVTITETVTDTLTDTLADTVEVSQEFLAWSSGYIQLTPEFCSEMDIFANGGQNPFIDSIIIGDSVFYSIDASYWYHESEPWFYFGECEDGSPTYESGDTAEISIYGSGLSSTCRVVALDYWDDWAVVTVPDDGDTNVTTTGNGFTVYWTYIPNAEWYGVELNYHLDSAGENVTRNIYTYTYDTTYTVADSIDGIAVMYVYLYALPTTGPDPESGLSNWTGDLMTGKFYGIGDYGWADVYFVNPVVAKPVAVSKPARPEKAPKEILKAITEAYR